MYYDEKTIRALIEKMVSLRIRQMEAIRNPLGPKETYELLEEVRLTSLNYYRELGI